MNTHRWVGLTAAIFLIILTVTGIGLQHPNTFGLSQRFVQNETILSWYGLKMGKVDTAFRLGESYLVLSDGEVYWQNSNLLQVESLTGAALADNLLVFTDAFYYYLFDATTAEPIEQSKAPAIISQSGVVDGRLVFRSQTSWFEFIEATTQFTEATPVDSKQLIQPVTLPIEVEQQLNQAKISHIISWEQLLTDIHTGRLFGGLGTLLIDLAALAILLLAITGLWSWSTRRKT